MKLKSFLTNAALILTTVMLVVAVATMANAQVYTDLFNFDGNDGSQPGIAALAQGRDGNLYGTTPYGGTSDGVVFKITPNGTQRVLHNFDGTDGAQPYGGLTLGTDGNFYGTADGGGANNYGTIFKITKSGSLTTLYSFGTISFYPVAAPIQGADGNFYGTTLNGTAYKITPSGTFTSLGALPGEAYAPLLQATDGNFYGTTESGGSGSCQGGCGTVFKITFKGVVKIVYNFDSAHGAIPQSAVIQGADGNFYGTAGEGGTYGEGVVYRLTPQGVITVLHNFPDPNYPNDGWWPLAGLVQASDGNFYGVTEEGGTAYTGVIFRITTTGAYSILYNFGYTYGSNPAATLMQHTNGKIYGLAEDGTYGYGVVYSFDMGLGPFVCLVSTLGTVGRPVEILGQGFTGTTAVSFNGTPATYTIASDRLLGAIVPEGATTGFVTVTTPSGTLTSNQEFTVKP